MATSIKPNTQEHSHTHIPNNHAVIPTPVRLDADNSLSGKGITIAFLDSGFYPHPDLTDPANRIVEFVDITDPDAELDADRTPESWDWHGTQTSVVAAGNGHLSDGVYRGVAHNANVVLVKVSARGKITDENIARGIRWVIANKSRLDIRILSISLGGDEDSGHESSIVDQAAEDAVKAGIVVVVAAGNAGCTDRPRPLPPANAPSVITVGGYDDKNLIGDQNFDLYCSSFGPTVDGILKPEIIAPAIWVAAPILPGTDFYKRAEALSQLAVTPDYLLKSIVNLTNKREPLPSSLADCLWETAELNESLKLQPPDAIRNAASMLLKENKIVATHYQHVDGTSFAAPIVASVVALMLEANSSLTPAMVKHILISASDRIPGADLLRQGYGVMNARRTVETACKEEHKFNGDLLLSPLQTNNRVFFCCHYDEATRISLVGDFNGWNPDITKFIRSSNGLWHAEIEVPRMGRYCYKFIVDESSWIEDRLNPRKELDGFGGFNSILEVK